MRLDSAGVVLAWLAVLTGVLVLAAGTVAIVARRGADVPGAPGRRERWRVLAWLLGRNAFLARLASWPCLWLAIRELVPAMPGAMCGYGVLQATPRLSLSLIAVKTLTLLALLASWLRGRLDDADPRRIPRALPWLALGFVLADAAADLAFVTADRELVEVSCCTTVVDGAERLSIRLPQQLLGARTATTSLALQGAVTAIAILALLAGARRLRRGAPLPLAAWGGLVLVSLLTLPLGLITSMEWLAPRILHLPHHHCPVEAWTSSADGPVLLALLLVGALAPLAAALQRGRAVDGGPPAVLLGGALRGAALAMAGFAAMVLTHGIASELGL